MEDCPNSLENAFSYAYTLRLEAEEDIKKGDLDYAMHKLKAMAHTYINALKAHPDYDECLNDAIKDTLDMMGKINSKVREEPRKQKKTLADIIIGKKIREDISRFVGRVRRSPYSQVSAGDSTLLLYGPSGTGKSFLAEAIAKEYGTSCVKVNCSDVNQKYRGEGEKFLTNIFQEAEKANSCIFFDEIHLLFAFKDGEEASGENGFVLHQFLTEMNNKSRGCLIIGATIAPWKISSTVRRRFEKHVYIPFPDQPLRQALLKYLIANCGMASALRPQHLEKYATKLEGYSPDDINKVINCAAEYGDKKLEDVKYFKKVPCSGKDIFIPCKPSHSGAEQYSWKTCPGIVVSVLTVPLMDKALEETHPNGVSELVKNEFEEYARKK